MPVLAFDLIGNVEDYKVADEFFRESRERLEKNPIMKGYIWSIDGVLHIINMNILTPPFYWYSLLGVMLGFIFNWFWVWSICLGFFGVGLFFWESPLVILWGVKKGLKKVGFKGKIKTISYKKALKRLMYGPSRSNRVVE